MFLISHDGLGLKGVPIARMETPLNYRKELFGGVKNSFDKKEELRRIVITTQRFFV